MKAVINVDFAKMFFYPEDVHQQGNGKMVGYAEQCVEKFSNGDEVEVLKVIEDAELEGGKGYLIYNSSNHASTVVAEHVLSLKA